MTWTRLSDDFADHPELLAATRSARLLFVEILIYGNRHGNNGRFRRGLVGRMTDAEDWPDLVDELVKREVLLEHEGDFLEADWEAWGQEPAEAVRERRDANAERNRQYRERGKRHQAGDHSLCTSRCPAKSREASRTESRDESRDDTPSRPLPSRPEERGKGRGGTAPADHSARATRSTDAAALRPGGTPYQLGITPDVTVVRK